MAVKKVPKNYDTTWNRRKQRLAELEQNQLPDVTSSDNGKFLGVTNGKWQPVTGGGTDVFTVAITYDSEQAEFSADMTHAEILAAITSGSTVRATYDGRTYVYAGTGKDSAGTPIYFSYTQSDSESQMIEKVFEIDEDERMVFSEHNIAEELPDVTSADNGKVLTVVNGVWTPHFFNNAALLWQSSEVVSGEYVSNSDGSIVTDSTGARSPFVEVVQDKVTIFAASDWNNIYNCWYDENRNFISSFSLSRGGTDFGKLEVVNKPSNAKYLCLSNAAAAMPNIRAWDGDIT